MNKSNPMDWKKLLCQNRLGKANAGDTPDVRTPFESDVDRIIFSGSFRRLSRKTQVHPFCKNDHVHNRLTHSLEVAQVGRSLGTNLGKRIEDKLPEGINANDLGAIVRAACLAHDIGNPPFGHAGEEAISHWFKTKEAENFLTGLDSDEGKDLSRFEGNAQGFRMITQTENHLFTGGLRLTYATLGAFCKYPWSSKHSQGTGKFGCYLTEEKILEKVAQNTGLIKFSDGKFCRHPLAYLSEAADDICYATIDIEDAVELNVLQPEDAYNTILSALPDKAEEIRNDLQADSMYRVNFARIRGPVFDTLIKKVVDSFMKNYDAIMQGTFEGDLFNSLDNQDPVRTVIEKAKDVGKHQIYTDKYKTEIELGCFTILESLLGTFFKAAHESYKTLNCKDGNLEVSWKSNLVLRQLGEHAPRKDNSPPGTKTWSKYDCFRRVLDNVGGMTDNYATSLAEKFRGVGTLI